MHSRSTIGFLVYESPSFAALGLDTRLLTDTLWGVLLGLVYYVDHAFPANHARKSMRLASRSSTPEKPLVQRSRQSLGHI